MGVLFGTDGVRGVANRELTPELAFRLGRAGAYVISQQVQRPRLVVGRDTRASGDLLEAGLVAGILSVGGEAYRAGILPTPAVAYLTASEGFSAGVVISASHNPVQDNGIKFIGPNGFKLPDRVEEQIESLARRETDELPRPAGAAVGRAHDLPEAEEYYVRFALGTAGRLDLRGMKIAVDCAHGAAYRITPRVLRELGAEVVTIGTEPDGSNINDGVGSTHPEALRELVLREKADLGLAHDGDADRLIAVDSNGNVVDGDQIMVICGLRLKQRGELAQNRVVVTVMSNLGLRLAFREAGVEVRETRVGDRYVLEEMQRSGAVLGGEQSGHIIFLQHSTTGDGLITALQLLAAVRESGRPLKELAGLMTRYPQVMVNVRLRDRERALASPALAAAVREAEARLGERGRILVRPSGTEPLLRIMAEGQDRTELEQLVEEMARAVEADA